MKRNILLLAVFVVLTQVNKAQLARESLIGKHAGSLNWERLPGTIELMDNYTYIIKSYIGDKEVESTTRGRWRVEGDHVLLTDLMGVETVLRKFKNECYITTPNGQSCIARFYLNKDLEEYLVERRRTGC